MSIRTELEALKDHDGLVQPERAVHWAKKNPKSELYADLKCDDDETAAHEWRLWKVRSLISLHIRNEQGVRQFVSLSIDRRRPGGGYRELSDVMASKSMRAILLDDALAELERVRLKYDSLTELAAVWNAVEQVKEERTIKPKPAKRGRTESTVQPMA